MTIELIIAIVSGMATCLPLAVKLIQITREAVKERNWTKMLDLVIELMEDAEEFLQDGASKKQWVLSGLKSLQGFAGFDIDDEVVSNLIDNLAGMSKNVNAQVIEQ